MSTNTKNNDDEEEVDEVCASCGIKGVDDIKLIKCITCKLVQYCSVACQKEHMPQHERACRIHAAKLREELLFKQPEISHMGECPICCLPLSIDSSKCKYQTCCSVIICDGCVYAERLCEVEESQKRTCPFCRTHMPETQVEADHFCMKRIEANDPVAIRERGSQQYQEQNYTNAFELYTKAAGLGDVEAHFQLANMYMDGIGVNKDKKKETHHFEEAAIGGHPVARCILGCLEGKGGRWERSVKHLIIAANLGCDDSLESLKRGYMVGLVKKEDLAAALRAHKAAVDATKSPQREAAEQDLHRLVRL